MDKNTKSRENRVRRQLAKQGYRLHKSRSRGVYLNDLGGYTIVDADCNFVIAGANFDLSLEDVEQFVAE